jgi:hypothetical protein
MEKQTKNIISREKIEKKLRSDNRASLKVSTLAFLATALVGILWVVLFIPFFFESPNLGLGVLFFLFVIVGTVPAWALLPNFVKDLKEYRHLKNGDIEIVTRPLLYETEETCYTRKTRIEYTKHKFHFEGFDAFLASPEQSKAFTRDDEFYIVYYKGSKKIRLMYSFKFYEYKEDSKE